MRIANAVEASKVYGLDVDESSFAKVRDGGSRSGLDVEAPHIIAFAAKW